MNSHETWTISKPKFDGLKSCQLHRLRASVLDCGAARRFAARRATPQSPNARPHPSTTRLFAFPESHAPRRANEKAASSRRTPWRCARRNCDHECDANRCAPIQHREHRGKENHREEDFPSPWFSEFSVPSVLNQPRRACHRVSRAARPAKPPAPPNAPRHPTTARPFAFPNPHAPGHADEKAASSRRAPWRFARRNRDIACFRWRPARVAQPSRLRVPAASRRKTRTNGRGRLRYGPDKRPLPSVVLRVLRALCVESATPGLPPD